jgi:hypothetical protein
MHRSLLLLAVAALLVACNAPSHSGAADAGPRFSWEKAGTAPVADNSIATVLAVREEYSLIELARSEKAEPKTRLQLTKGGKNLIVEVLKSDDKTTVVGVVIGQTMGPALRVGDEVTVSPLAQ